MKTIDYDQQESHQIDSLTKTFIQVLAVYAIGSDEEGNTWEKGKCFKKMGEE